VVYVYVRSMLEIRDKEKFECEENVQQVAAAVNEITWRQRARYYLNSNIRPLINVRKLFWRLISVAELSAIAPNICEEDLREYKTCRHSHAHCSTLAAAMDTVTMVTSTNTATMTTAMTSHTMTTWQPYITTTITPQHTYLCYQSN